MKNVGNMKVSGDNQKILDRLFRRKTLNLGRFWDRIRTEMQYILLLYHTYEELTPYSGHSKRIVVRTRKKLYHTYEKLTQ